MQNKEVDVYRRNNSNGTLRLVKTFDSLDDLVDRTNSFDNFSCNDNDRHTCGLFRWDSDYNERFSWENLKASNYCYVVINRNNKVVPPDVLVGINRRLRYDRVRKWYYSYNSWSKRGNGHCFRRMKTTQERRWADAWSDEEFAPKPRAKRRGHNLPNVYDDYWRGSDGKNWKNYRSHQWKEKGVAKATPQT